MYHNGNKYKFFFENSADAMLIIENGKFLDCNLATVELLGYENKEGIINSQPFELSPETQPDGRPSIEKAEEMIKVAIERGNHRFEWDHLRKDKTVIPVEVTLTAIQSNGKLHLHTVWRDISRRKHAEHSKEETEELFRYTFEANPDPVIIAKIEGGSIVSVNKAFEDVTGILRHDALGRNSEQLGLWCNLELRQSFLEKLRTHGQVTNFEADFRVYSGLVKTGLVSARIIQLNKEPCMLLVIRDSTQEKAIKQDLVNKNQAKNDFITTTAHELKTPLTAILGFTELLLDPLNSHSFSDQQKEDFLKQIYERGEALHRLIKDLLDISHIDSGQTIPMKLKEADLAVLLNKAYDYYRVHEPEYSFELVLPEEPYSPTLYIDSKRICQILDNLLSNAVKYSPKGSKIVLRGEILSDEWKVCVKDCGIGMSQDQVSKIFDKFYRANPAKNKVEGLGLGMSIVKEIVQSHRGTINIESAIDTGTTVTICLPLNGVLSSSAEQLT
jgi:PAS domain S-box-containing protein